MGVVDDQQGEVLDREFAHGLGAELVEGDDLGRRDGVTWGATLYIYGRFNKNLSKNTIYFNSIKATISYCDSKIIKVTVPSTLVDSTSVISLLSSYNFV